MNKREKYVTGSEWGQIIAHAWTNKAFATQLQRNPARAVKEFLNIDDDLKVIIFQLPPRPQDLTDEQLEAVSSGKEVAYLCPQYSC